REAIKGVADVVRGCGRPRAAVGAAHALVLREADQDGPPPPQGVGVAAPELDDLSQARGVGPAAGRLRLAAPGNARKPTGRRWPPRGAGPPPKWKKPGR